MVAAALLLAACFDFDALRQEPADLSAAADGPGDAATGDDLSAVYAFAASWPQHRSQHYGSHDRPPATLSFTYAADSVACSHDGGNTWAACDTPNTLVFTPDDYNQAHVLAVKLSKSGFDDAVYTFNPSVDLPGLHFYACDQVVSVDESVEAFYARLQAGRAICLKSGVTITFAPFDAGVTSGASGVFLDSVNGNNLKVLGTESNRPVFINTRVGGNQGAFVSMSSSLTGVVLANLQLHVEDGNPISFELNGGANTFSYVDVLVLGGGNDNAVAIGAGAGNTFYNVDIDASGSYGTPSLHVSGNATVTLTGGKIVGRDDTVTVLVEGATATLSGVEVDNLTATTNTPKSPGVQLGTGSLTMSGGSVTCLHDGLYLGTGVGNATGTLTGVSVRAGGTGVSIGYMAVATLSGLTLQTAGPGMIIDGAQVHLDSTLLDRLDQAGAAGPAIDLKNSVVLSSTNNGNHFCDQNLGGPNKFSAALTVESGASNIGNFDLAKQVNMGVIDQCP